MNPNDSTLIDTLARQVCDRADATAIQCGDRRLTFAELDHDSNQIANALAACGIGQGARVACLTQHHIECLLLTLAACKLGAVCMPVNWRLAPNELAYVIRHGEAKLLMADAAFLPLVAEASLQQDLQQLVCTERPEGTVKGFADWYQAAASTFEPISAHPDDAALQLYSSGTTGQPKGVVLTHRGLLSTCETVAHDWQFGEHDVNGNPLPTFHVAGMTMLLLTVWSGGRTVAFSAFNPAAFNGAIAEQRITHAFLVPAMLLFMLQQPNAKSCDYRSLRLIAYGGSPISEKVLTDAIVLFGCDFLQVYGLTEVSGPVSFLMPEDHRRALASRDVADLLRSAGRAAGGAQVRIADPVDGTAVADGTVGEIWIESIRNLKCYWRDDEATARAFPEGRNQRGGWFRSGDAGYLQDGVVFIHDRIKDMIISGGENIYPAEVENVLAQHPAVADGAVIGVPDDTWGEAVKACVVLKPSAAADAEADAASIIGFMRERLAHFKCPRSVDFMDTLPRNPSGKLLKRMLRQPYWQDRTRAVN